MKSEKKSVFTTIGWDGKNKFFAVEEHFKRLKKHANISKIEFDKKLEENIINKLKNQKLKKIKTRYGNKYGKPSGLIKIAIYEDGSFSIKERDNEYNIKCEKIDAITVEAPINLKNNQGVKFGKHLAYKNALNIAKQFEANAALLIEKNIVIDGDRGSLIILDNDGVAWVSSCKYGSIQSITVELIKEKLLKRGIPILFGKITTNMILNSCDAIMVGTGIGVMRINSIDKRNFNFSSSKLFDEVILIFDELMNEKWIELY